MLLHAWQVKAGQCYLAADSTTRQRLDKAHGLHGLVLGAAGGVLLQAAQVRKSNYVPERGLDYDPETNNTSTVYAGTTVQQV